MKADGKGPHRLSHQLRHQRHVRRRINAARKKHAERHVGHHALFDRGPQQIQNVLPMLFLCAGDRRYRRQRIPVLSDARFAVAIDDQHVPSGKFLNSAKECLRRRRRDKSQIVIQRGFIYFPANGWMFEDGFDLGSEDEPAVLLIKVERLDAGPVARQHQSLQIGIPEGNRIIAFDVRNKVGPALLVKM